MASVLYISEPISYAAARPIASRTPVEKALPCSVPEAMVVLTKPSLGQVSLTRPQKPNHHLSGIPVINLSQPGSEALVVRACEELGFFKVTDHGIPMELIAKLEEEAVKFFALPQTDKERVGPASPFGYGSKNIGCNGDTGWVEYLLMEITSKPMSHASLAVLTEPSASSFR